MAVFGADGRGLLALTVLTAFATFSNATSSCASHLGDCHHGHSVPHLHEIPFHKRQQVQSTLGPAYQAAASITFASEQSNTTRVFVPAAFGGDPTGKADSTRALQAAISAMIAVGTPSLIEGVPMTDLGGAILDFAGGVYVTNEGLSIPPQYANFNIQDGTLRAGAGFPVNDTLLLLGGGTIKGAGCLNVAVRRMTLDGSLLAGTALYVDNGQYVNVGPAVMLYGFNQYGVRMDGTGGCFIHQSWLGEQPPRSNTYYTPGAYQEINNLTATAISLEADQHDCYITDVIIWSALVGIKTKNGANTFSHVHPWNLKDAVGGIGFYIEAGTSHVSQLYVICFSLQLTGAYAT